MQYNVAVPTRSLYLHWPFCPYKCNFCPFVALASQDQFMEQYHKALCQEITQYVQACSSKQAIDTIFIGGGTPSTYPDNLLLDTFGILYKSFDIQPDAEVTIEVNPGTVRIEQLALWKKIGINRISIGVQSLNDAVLKKLNRHQSAEDVHRLLRQASEIFDNISVDLILGLPEISTEEWKQLLEQVVTWPIKHVSVYFLTVHEETPLYYKVKTKKVVLPADDTLVDLYNWTVQTLEKAGIFQYEISNFARKGYESRHNSVYWDRVPYKAFGLGACSFDGSKRFQNEKSIMTYIKGIEQGRDVTVFSECLSPEQIQLERIMLGLRRAQGMPLATLVCGIPEEKHPLLIKKLTSLQEQKFIEETEGRWRLTLAGLAVENEIVVQLSV